LTKQHLQNNLVKRKGADGYAASQEAAREKTGVGRKNVVQQMNDQVNADVGNQHICKFIIDHAG